MNNKKPTRTVSDIKAKNGEIINFTKNPKQFVNEFNHFFVGVAENLVKNTPKITFSNSEMKRNPDSFFLYPTTSAEILKCFSELRSNAAPGHDGLTCSFLKPLMPVLATPLSIIFNCSMFMGQFPNSYKLASVCPIFKGGDRSSVDNYRPISF